MSYARTPRQSTRTAFVLLACLLAFSFTSSYKNSIQLLYSRCRYKGTQLQLALITLACTFTSNPSIDQSTLVITHIGQFIPLHFCQRFSVRRTATSPCERYKNMGKTNCMGKTREDTKRKRDENKFITIYEWRIGWMLLQYEDADNYCSVCWFVWTDCWLAAQIQTDWHKQSTFFLDETALRTSEAPTHIIVLPGNDSFVEATDTSSYAHRYDIFACCIGDRIFAA